MTDFVQNPLLDAEPVSQWQGTWDSTQVQADWLPLLSHFFSQAIGQQLKDFLQTRLAAEAVVFPPQPFAALELTALAKVRVVILGQDPYHGAGQAEGLAFSVARGIKIPPSLRNIFKEIQRDVGSAARGVGLPTHGSLRAWAAQGVLLLNTCLTVEEGQPASHAKRGWEILTDALIEACAQKSEGIVFMLWGAHAQAKRALIASHNAEGRHLVLTANHPSPRSAMRPPEPFIGCGHFGQARRWLQDEQLFS
ncbi:MAG: uracil-DNA glycosylase [Brachymonas sp.]